nr:hypothetical protein [Tanacetum cinerariifolium]
MTSLADKVILSGADNHPSMLEKDMYDLWKSRMELYMLNRQHGWIILESIENDPLLWPTIEENVYALVSTHKILKELWERIQMLMQGTSLTKQEKECKLYDEFDKFAYRKGESLRDFYLRFLLLLNDMNIYNVKLEQFQVNTKFLNTLTPEWSKFVTDVKLVRDMHTTNVDQLHANLGQHEYHANESSSYATPYHPPRYASQVPSSTYLSITYPPNDFQSSVNHNVYNASSSIPQMEYAPTIHQRTKFSPPDTGLIVPVFQKGDNPIDAINHMISFLTAVVTSRYPATNNQLRTSSNPPKIALMVNLSRYRSDNLAEINQDNKNVNEILTAELERHKKQERILKEQNNVDKASVSCAQSLEIETLKHTLSKHLKEKDSLKQKVTLLKNDFQKEESRNIDRELALEKQVKELNNIVFKRNQSA